MTWKHAWAENHATIAEAPTVRSEYFFASSVANEDRLSSVLCLISTRLPTRRQECCHNWAHFAII